MLITVDYHRCHHALSHKGGHVTKLWLAHHAWSKDGHVTQARPMESFSELWREEFPLPFEEANLTQSLARTSCSHHCSQEVLLKEGVHGQPAERSKVRADLTTLFYSQVPEARYTPSHSSKSLKWNVKKTLSKTMFTVKTQFKHIKWSHKLLLSLYYVLGILLDAMLTQANTLLFS